MSRPRSPPRSTASIFILLLARPVLGEPIGWRQWLGVAIAFCGVALIGTQGELLAPTFSVGDVCARASMAMWGSYTVVLRLRRDALDTPQYLTVPCTLGLVFMAPWVAWEVASPIGARTEGLEYA